MLQKTDIRFCSRRATALLSRWGVSLAVLPIILYAFHRLSLVGILTNVLIVPVQPLILFAGSEAGLLAGLIGLWLLAQLLFWCCGWGWRGLLPLLTPHSARCAGPAWLWVDMGWALLCASLRPCLLPSSGSHTDARRKCARPRPPPDRAGRRMRCCARHLRWAHWRRSVRWCGWPCAPCPMAACTFTCCP